MVIGSICRCLHARLLRFWVFCNCSSGVRWHVACQWEILLGGGVHWVGLDSRGVGWSGVICKRGGGLLGCQTLSGVLGSGLGWQGGGTWPVCHSVSGLPFLPRGHVQVLWRWVCRPEVWWVSHVVGSWQTQFSVSQHCCCMAYHIHPTTYYIQILWHICKNSSSPTQHSQRVLRSRRSE